MEVTNRFQEIDLEDGVLEELWMEVCNTVWDTVTRIIPNKKKCKKAKGLSEEALQIAKERQETKGKVERELYTQVNAEFQRRDKKVFLNEQCKEMEEKNIKGKTRDLKKIEDIKRTFHARMGKIKNRNCKGLTGRRGGKNTQKNCTRKVLMPQITRMV